MAFAGYWFMKVIATKDKSHTEETIFLRGQKALNFWSSFALRQVSTQESPATSESNSTMISGADVWAYPSGMLTAQGESMISSFSVEMR